MNLNKWIYNQIRSVVLEDFRYQYDKESFLPPPSVLDQVAKAYQYIQKNNLVSGTGGNEGSGLQKATAILKKEPLNHAQLKRMKAFFDNNYEAVQKEKGLGKDITNSSLIQSWELWGGDYGREWVNNRIDSVQNKNDRSKNLRPKGHKRMMDPNNTRIHSKNVLYKGQINEAEKSQFIVEKLPIPVEIKPSHNRKYFVIHVQPMLMRYDTGHKLNSNLSQKEINDGQKSGYIYSLETIKYPNSVRFSSYDYKDGRATFTAPTIEDVKNWLLKYSNIVYSSDLN